MVNSGANSTSTSTFNTGNLTKATTYSLTTKYTVNSKSYSLTSANLTINVKSLASEDVSASITYNNNSSLALDSTSNYSDPYNFSISYTPASGSAIPASALTGSIDYAITNSSGESIISGTSSSLGQLSIDLSKINTAGKYTLTANISLTDPNYSTDKITATFDITYNSVSISASTGTLTNGVLNVSENDTSLKLTADTSDIYNGTSFTYQ